MCKTMLACTYRRLRHVCCAGFLTLGSAPAFSLPSTVTGMAFGRWVVWLCFLVHAVVLTHTLWLWMVYSVDERKTAGSAYWTHSPRAAMEECGWTVRSPAYHAAWRSCVCVTCTMAMRRSTTRLLGSGWCRK